MGIVGQLGNVQVIGAGVIGLTTALLLQQKGYQVTVIADHFPGEKSINYTSPYAGARWETAAPNSDQRLQKYDAISYNFFWDLAKNYSAEAGIMIVPAYDYFEKPTNDNLNPWWKNMVPTFQEIDKNELPEGATFGYHFTTILINPNVYLPWLMKQFTLLGGKTKKQTINHISDVITDNVDIVVNCSGFRAKNLGGVMDPKVTPLRGQNIVIKAPHIRSTMTMTKLKNYTYIIPRSDGTVILGTTKELNNSNPKANDAVRKDILERAYSLCPKLSLSGQGVKSLQVVEDIVGLRPTREGGPRVENEYYTTPTGKQVLITHNYGHGGSGYQSSWGTAKEALQLIHEGRTVMMNKSNDLRHLLSRL